MKANRSNSLTGVETELSTEALSRAYEELFEHITDIPFFIKDVHGRFLRVNGVFAKTCGFPSPQAIIGRTDLDIWPRYLAEKYRKDDQEILTTGQSLVNMVELVYDGNKSTHWFSTTKIPIKDSSGQIVGIAGYTRDLKRVDDGSRNFTEMGEVFDYIMANYREPIDIKKLASLACLSISQFERKFKSLFKTTPRLYLIMVRLHATCRALANSDESISAIAYRHGFYDLSHLNRLFKEHMGMTPTQYRRTFRAKSEIP